MGGGCPPFLLVINYRGSMPMVELISVLIIMVSIGLIFNPNNPLPDDKKLLKKVKDIAWGTKNNA